MTLSKNRESILIPSEQIQFLQERLESICEKIPPTSRFQVFHGQFEDKTVILYKSGIFVYDPPLSQPLELVLEKLGLIFPKSHAESNPKKRKGKKKSLWLTETQLNRLQDKLSDMEVEIQQLNNEIKIKSGNSELIISKNQGITYYDNQIFSSIITEVIKHHEHFNSVIHNIGINSIGLKSVFGPIIFSIVLLDKEQAISLQLNGLKNPNFTRSKPDKRIFDYVVDLNLKSIVYSVYPEEINQTDDLHLTLKTKIHEYLHEFIELSDSFRIYIDPKDPLLEFFNKEDMYNIELNSDMAKTSITNTLSTNLALLEFAKWKTAVETKLGYYISPKMLIDIENEKNMVFHDFIFS